MQLMCENVLKGESSLFGKEKGVKFDDLDTELLIMTMC